MESTTIQIHNVSPDTLTALFTGLQNQLNEIKSNLVPKQPTEYLTRNEVAKLLKCDLSTVHNWTKAGKLLSYGIGNRV